MPAFGARLLALSATDDERRHFQPLDGLAASRRYGGELSCQTAQSRLRFAFRGGFPRDLTGRASGRGRQGLETSLGDVAAALDALPVGAAVELRQRLVDLLEQLGMYRQQREVEVALDVSLAVLGEVRAGLTLPGRVFADGATLSARQLLEPAALRLERVPERSRSHRFNPFGDVPHGSSVDCCGPRPQSPGGASAHDHCKALADHPSRGKRRRRPEKRATPREIPQPRAVVLDLASEAPSLQCGRQVALTQGVPARSTVTAAAAFRLDHVSKMYRMGDVEVHALRDVSLEVRAGEFVVLLGPSGSGKSTLLNIIGGLDTPTSGEVIYADHNLTHADERSLTDYRRHHVGFVFQFYNLIPSLTARENVALVTDIVDHPLTPDEALDLVGLAPRADHFPSQLSGGEQQRVAIARAIAKRPSVLLCDEPTGALDLATGVVVLDAIDRVATELGTTTVVITHNASVADMADRVLTLADGRVTGEHRNARRARAQDLHW